MVRGTRSAADSYFTLPHCFLGGVAVEFPRAPIPVDDAAIGDRARRWRRYCRSSRRACSTSRLSCCLRAVTSDTMTTSRGPARRHRGRVCRRRGSSACGRGRSGPRPRSRRGRRPERPRRAAQLVFHASSPSTSRMVLPMISSRREAEPVRVRAVAEPVAAIGVHIGDQRGDGVADQLQSPLLTVERFLGPASAR